MKKLILLGAALCFVLALAACGGGSSSGSAASNSGAGSSQGSASSSSSSEPEGYTDGAIQAAADAGAFSETLDEVDEDTAFALYRLADYGLEREDMTACTVRRSSGATCEEAAVLTFRPEAGDKLDKVEQALEDYVQGQIDANEDYRPDEIPKLEKAFIDRRGDTFLLLVANDPDIAKEAVK